MLSPCSQRLLLSHASLYAPPIVLPPTPLLNGADRSFGIFFSIENGNAAMQYEASICFVAPPCVYDTRTPFAVFRISVTGDSYCTIGPSALANAYGIRSIPPTGCIIVACQSHASSMNRSFQKSSSSNTRMSIGGSSTPTCVPAPGAILYPALSDPTYALFSFTTPYIFRNALIR